MNSEILRWDQQKNKTVKSAGETALWRSSEAYVYNLFCLFPTAHISSQTHPFEGLSCWFLSHRTYGSRRVHACLMFNHRMAQNQSCTQQVIKTAFFPTVVTALSENSRYNFVYLLHNLLNNSMSYSFHLYPIMNQNASDGSGSNIASNIFWSHCRILFYGAPFKPGSFSCCLLTRWRLYTHIQSKPSPSAQSSIPKLVSLTCVGENWKNQPSLSSLFQYAKSLAWKTLHLSFEFLNYFLHTY